jgi:hypothetical protein
MKKGFSESDSAELKFVRFIAKNMDRLIWDFARAHEPSTRRSYSKTNTSQVVTRWLPSSTAKTATPRPRRGSAPPTVRASEKKREKPSGRKQQICE